MAFDFSQMPPRAAKGIPAQRITLSGGRTAVDLAPHGGLAAVRYMGPAGLGGRELFHADLISAWTQLFRPYAVLEKREQYFLEFTDSAFYPFGYDSRCELGGVWFRHRFTVVNDGLIFELEREDGGPFSLMLGLTCASALTHRPGRTWKRAESDGSVAVMRCADNGVETAIFIGGEEPLRHRATGQDIQKDYFTVAARNGCAALAVGFGGRVEHLQKCADAERARYRASAATRLRSPELVLDGFVHDFPEVLKSLAVRDIPGAVCASNTGYWVWGWDSMVHSDAMMLAGMRGEMLRRLRYYRDTADPVDGIFHAIDTGGKVICSMAPAAQTIYCIMLYNAWLFGRDAESLREFYPFSARLLDRARQDVVGESELCKGLSLYPDFPADLGQDGEDISSFNNSILFQAARGMAVLARQFGEKDDATRFDAFADGVRAGFRRYLYDPREHYFYDSISVRDFSPRGYYPLYAVLYLTSFADELVEGIEEDVAKYMLETFTERSGVAMFGRKYPIFYSDGNQLGMYSTVIEGFYRRMVRRLNVPDTLLPIIRNDWSRLELSEANSCEAINMRLTTDHPGKKQMYAAVSYYSLIFGVFCGLEFSPETLRVRPPTRAQEGWAITGLPVGEGALDVCWRGIGSRIARLELDGRMVCEVPIAVLSTGLHSLIVFLAD